MSQSRIHVKFLSDYPSAISTVAEWVFEGLQLFRDDGQLSTMVKKYEKMAQKGKLPCAFIACDKAGKVFGTASLVSEDMPGRSDLSPWLAALYVDAEYRKKGIGKILVKRVISEAEQLGYKRIYLFTGQDYRKFYYENLGWCVIDTFTYQGKPKVVMEYAIEHTG